MDLFGHENAKQEILRSIAIERLPHAWLISGQKGIGKATLAFQMSYLIIQNNLYSHDKHPVAVDFLDWEKNFSKLDQSDLVLSKILNFSHPQFLYISPEMDGKSKPEIIVENVRKIHGFLRLTSREGGWRIVMIDSAEKMNRNAQNAVLKIIEEPPNRVAIVLVSHSEGRLLPTIRSRCRRLILRPVGVEHLKDLIKQYFPELSSKEQVNLALLANGSPGRAIELMDSNGLEFFNDIRELFYSIPEIDNTSLYQFIDRFSGKNTHETFKVAIDVINWWISNIIISAARGKPPQKLHEEKKLFLRLGKFGVTRWFHHKDKLEYFYKKTDILHLDKPQVILNFFLGLRELRK